jgi:hypothetical protein
VVPQAQTFDFTGAVTSGVLVGAPVYAQGSDLAGSVTEGVGTIFVYSPCWQAGVFVRVGLVATVVLPAGGGMFALTLQPPLGPVHTSYTLVGPAFCP